MKQILAVLIIAALATAALAGLKWFLFLVMAIGILEAFLGLASGARRSGGGAR